MSPSEVQEDSYTNIFVLSVQIITCSNTQRHQQVTSPCSSLVECVCMVVRKKMPPKQVSILGGVAWMKEVCRCGGGLWGLFAQASFNMAVRRFPIAFWSRCSILSPSAKSSCTMPYSCYDHNELNPWNHMPASVKCFLDKSYCSYGVSSQP